MVARIWLRFEAQRRLLSEEGSASSAVKPEELLRVTVLEKMQDDAELRASWNSLVMQMNRPEVFYTYEWALAASRAFEGTLRPLICLVYDSDRLCGIAPLAIAHEDPGNVFFLTAATADYCDVLSSTGMRHAVLSSVFGELAKLATHDVTLTNVPSNSVTCRELSEIAKINGFLIHKRPAYQCGLILLGNQEERQALLAAVRKKEKEKRGLKKMEQLGTVRLAQLKPEKAEEELQSIFSAQIGRFLATGRISPLVRADRRQFLTELARLLGRPGWLQVSRLEVNDRPVAWNYGFGFYDSWFWYLPAFETEYEASSPGSCLLRFLVEAACADPSVIRLDLGLGDEAYKERFANAVSSTCHFQLSTSQLRYWQWVARDPLTENLRRFPGVEKTIRRARDAGRDFRKRVQTDGTMASGMYLFQRAAKPLLSKEEICLFEANGAASPDDDSVTLVPVGWKELTDAAVRNADDIQTLQYLMRCASRLRIGASSGSVLMNRDSEPVHFLWVDRYDGFHLSEIDYELHGADPSAVMLFDCWTPLRYRGHGHYANAIQAAAESLWRQHKQAWIFSARKNEPSMRGIRKAGFTYRFSLVRSCRLGRSSVSRQEGIKTFSEIAG